MKRLIISLAVILISFGNLLADEGMWLPLLIKDRMADLQKNGFKLTAEDLYSINQASLKDAIVHFGGGCTGELISAEGLIITNHHCGFGQIQSHSSVENDYLRDGFWAMSKKEELPNRGLTVRFLVKMEDVTDHIINSLSSDLSEEDRAKIVSTKSQEISRKATENTHYQARVEPLYYGNQYFLFVYETYSDVRLVGAPPSSIGKFGGDTDNWMWPRHTGDFALFRIYADKDNKPADYSKDNVPYKPKRFFTISAKGVNEGDFTLVYGYPGRTQKYLHSSAVKYITDLSNPHKIKLRTMRLDVQRDEMSKSQEVRIKYASKNASVSNAWKKWQGEAKGIDRLKTVAVKENFESMFDKWSQDKPEYKGLISQFTKLYEELEPFAFATDYHNEAINANEILRLAGNITSAIARNSKMTPEVSANNIRQLLENFYKDYHLPVDKRSFIAIVNEYKKNVPLEMQPEFFKDIVSKKGSVEAVADCLFEASLFASREKALNAIKDGVTETTFAKDPAVLLYNAFNEKYTKDIKPHFDEINRNLTILYRTYMRGQMEFDKEMEFYPDANSTLRITYGKVKGYKPVDGVYYFPSSTLEGIMEKDNPEIYDYNIPQKLRDIYSSKDYGRWTVNGTVPVCFIATNHTSGGNSGSPVINAQGELIGINFDRVWEGTMSDIAYDPEVCRNISLDIRFVLFVIDKLAGANHLIEEMKINY